MVCFWLHWAKGCKGRPQSVVARETKGPSLDLSYTSVSFGCLGIRAFSTPRRAPGLWDKALLEAHTVSCFLEYGSEGSWQLFYSKPLPL